MPAHSEPTPGNPPQALFPEAEHHQRFRHKRISLLAILLLGAGAASVFAASGGTHASPNVPITNAQAFARSAIAATESARSARYSLTFEDQPRPSAGCARLTYWTHLPTEVTTDRGGIDFAASTVAASETYANCGTKTAPFCAFPRQMVESATTQYMATANQDTSCYGVPNKKAGIPTTGIITHGPPAARPWSETPEAQLAEFVGARNVLVSAQPLRVVSALSGRITKVGTATVSGVAATEYTGSTTLAAIQRVDNVHPVLTVRQGSLAPASAAVRVNETIWLDARGRIVQLATTEPLYVVVQASGARMGNATQVFSTMVEHGGRLIQENYELVTLDFTDFGAPVHITVPHQSEVLRAQ